MRNVDLESHDPNQDTRKPVVPGHRKAPDPPNLSIPSTMVTFLYEVHWLEGGSQTGVC
jgi:hypothetical protein